MELLMPEGKKIEKKSNSEMLEQIDGKLDLLLAAGKTETEG